MIFNKQKFTASIGGLLILIVAITLYQKVGYDTVGKEQTSLEINKDLLALNPVQGLVYFQNKPFTGTSISFYPNGIKATSIDYFEGKKHGLDQKWFTDGLLSYESNYVNGKKHGSTKSWWANGNLRSQSFAKKGISNGLHQQWYKSGAKFKVMNIVNGKEEGLQQSWRENGKIYNNYEARDGRIFGLKRANLCYELDNEIIQYKTD